MLPNTPPDEVRWLFLDLNSYFATVEQEMQPHLRGLPMAVVPVEATSTCCIAVSYQAKSYGICTGMAVADAKRRCPHLVLVNARPRHYVEYHHRIVAAIERCAPVHQVLSCDEFVVKLVGSQQEPAWASALAYAIKGEIRAVGMTLRCSIGLGPNRLLAKIAGEMQKPDGLMLLQRRHLPDALFPLSLRAIPGVGHRMEQRLIRAGVATTRMLCGLSRERMHTLWGGVEGDRLWLRLRGEDFEDKAAGPLQTLSRQHILPPDCRTMECARGIALKMLHAVARRLRMKALWAGGIFVQVGLQRGQAIQAGKHLEPTQDTLVLQGHLAALWEGMPEEVPTDLTIVLADLQPEPMPGLFVAAAGRASKPGAMRVVDTLNDRFGGNTVYLGSIHAHRQQAPTRISFGVPPPLEEFHDTADGYA